MHDVTHTDLWDMSWSWGFHGHGLAECVARVRESLRGLTAAQEAALATGHAEGVADATSYAADMAARADRAVATEPAF